MCECGRKGNHICKAPVEAKKARKSKKSEEAMSYRTAISGLVGIGTTHLTLFVDDVAELLTRIRGWLNDGSVTDFTILAFGAWNRNSRRHLLLHLEKIGHSWVNNHVVFQLRNEPFNDFVARVVSIYEITHFFDAAKANSPESALAPVVMTPELTKVRVYHYEKESGQNGLRAWLVKSSPPEYPKPFCRDEEACGIIDIPVLDEVAS